MAALEMLMEVAGAQEDTAALGVLVVALGTVQGRLVPEAEEAVVLVGSMSQARLM
jgi:hypothetical protein